MTSKQKPEPGKKIVSAHIKRGPALYALIKAVTDPHPLGSYRTTKLELTRYISSGNIGSIINAVLRGMTRTGKDPKGFLNDYLWQITGGTELGQFGNTEGGGINFAIEEYSPITRRGVIYFSIPD
jgi:hypothetical protein